MSKSFSQPDARFADWIAKTYDLEDDLLRDVRARSAAADLPDIHVSAFDGRHLTVLAASVAARKAVEIGTLGGYSGICLLRGMGPDATLDTFELDAAHAKVANDTFGAAGVGDRVRLHLGRAQETLGDISADGPFDLVFLDADKEGYPNYLDWAARHLRPGGLVIGDNSFLFGELLDEPRGERAAAIKAMRAFHERLARGDEFVSTVIPTGEGLAVGVRR